MLNASPQAPHGGGESDGSAPRCGMSGCPSLWPWPRSCTTAHSARRWPGPGRRISSCTTRRSSGRILLPRRQAQCTFPLTTKMCLPPGCGRTGCLPCPDRKHGYPGAPCSRSSTSPLCRLSMILRRRWWYSCLTCSSASFGRSHLTPSRLSKCP